METKIIKKFFGLADFLDEQKFLEEQHSNGWKFKKFQWLRKYTFEKVEPEDYVYRLDYNEENKDETDYLQMFDDCGWEYIMKYQTWYYFRKKKSYINQSDNEIFSNRDSKLNMIKKVMWKQLIIMLPIIFFFFLYNYEMMNGFSKNDLGFQIVWIVYALFMAFLLGISVHNVIKLNQLIGEMQNPLDEK